MKKSGVEAKKTEMQEDAEVKAEAEAAEAAAAEKEEKERSAAHRDSEGNSGGIEWDCGGKVGR